jgi:hypothetical protein
MPLLLVWQAALPPGGPLGAGSLALWHMWQGTCIHTHVRGTVWAASRAMCASLSPMYVHTCVHAFPASHQHVHV